MHGFALTAGVAVAFFAVCMLAMAIGLFVRGMVLRGGCHSQSAPDGTSHCGACGREGGGTCRRRDDQGGKPDEENAA